MDLQIDDDVQALAALVREQCTALVTEDSLRELDARFGPGTETGGRDAATARFHERLWTELVRAGVPAALAPEAAGGSALGAVAEALVLRELGRALAPVPLSETVQAAWVAAAAGLTEGLPEMVADPRPGELWTVAVAGQIDVHPGAPGEAFGPEVDPGTLRATGEIADAPWTPLAARLLTVGPSAGRPRVVDVDLRAPGVQVERLVPVDYSCLGRVRLDEAEVHVPELAAGQEADLLETAELRARLHLAAWQWGAVEAALEITARYAGERRQFGRPIGSFQAVAGRLADGLVDVDAVRLTVLRAAAELDRSAGHPEPATRAAVATAHYWACEAGHRLAHTTVHVHGGVGLDRDAPAHRYFLGAKTAEFRLGGATRQLLDLGELLVYAGDPWDDAGDGAGDGAPA